MIDKDVQTKHVQRLNSRDAVASFFAYLGYDVRDRTEQRPANLGVTADSLKRLSRATRGLCIPSHGVRLSLLDTVRLSTHNPHN